MNMHRSLSLALYAACLGLIPNAAPAADDTSNWQNYANREFGFHIKFPLDWKVSQSSGTTKSLMIGKPRKANEPQEMMQFFLQKNQNPKQLPIKDWATKELAKMHAKSQPFKSENIGGRAAICLEHDSSFSHSFNYYVPLPTRANDILTIAIIQPSTEKSLKPLYERILESIRF